MRSTEFDGVFITTGENRPLFSHPPRVRASKYLEDKIQSESPVPQIALDNLFLTRITKDRYDEGIKETVA